MKTIMKMICFLAVSITILSFSSCSLLSYRGYDGEHVDLYSVAVNNVFGARGYLSNGEVSFDPEIHIIEKDGFGRTLFFYSEYYDDTAPEIDVGMAFAIMQKSEGDCVYYYQDVCYLPYFDTVSDWETVSKKLDTTLIKTLKELNDWDKEINTDKCTKAKINNKKPKGKLRPKDYELDEIIYPYEVENGYSGKDDSICKFSIFCEADSFGRELHYIYGMTMNTDKNGEDIFDFYEYAIILNADGSCSKKGIARIENIEESHKIINALKQNNNWNSKS